MSLLSHLPNVILFRISDFDGSFKFKMPLICKTFRNVSSIGFPMFRSVHVTITAYVIPREPESYIKIVLNNGEWVLFYHIRRNQIYICLERCSSFHVFFNVCVFFLLLSWCPLICCVHGKMFVDIR